MAYIGNQPTTVAFLTNTFNGTGSQTAFTLSAAPANTSSILVAVTGVLQDPSTYSVSGTTLTFSVAPPSGTGNISVRFLGVPASGVTTTAYRTQTEFTATAGQTTFTPPSYTPGFIDVYRNGLLLGSADYTATNGTTVVLANAAAAGDFIETNSFLISSVLNAIPATAGAVNNTYIQDGGVTTAKIQDGSVTASKLASGVAVTSLNGQTGAITNTSTNTIGSYGSFATLTNGAVYNYGDTIAGSSLRRVITTSPTNTSILTLGSSLSTSTASTYANPSLSGTWRWMSGQIVNQGGACGADSCPQGLLVRIS